MKIAGFTIIKNAVTNDFPIVEAISSILPVVDEMIILIGDSSDETIALIEAIGDPKIKIHHSVWNKNLRKGGAVLADETDKAFALVGDEYTWAFYIQGDELVHEKYHATIRAACEKYASDTEVQGLLFKYKHFYGTYDYVGDSRKWYANEIRIIRNNKAISAYRDAQGFRIGRTKLPVACVDASIYHYGWVKSPAQMRKKLKESSVYWNDDTEMEKIKLSPEDYDFTGFDSLEKFTGTHPRVMFDRIQKKNWVIDVDLSQKKFSFKNKCLYYFEKLTGIRPFDFKNYKIIRK
ncbi:MAG: glycosyltransferase family 2 protein [Sediminibacterium sp.]|nr:MAG: glycosyltransferase family 2 protein [Sediminibacterium sp.]